MFLLAAPLLAQNIADMQLFAPAEVRPYGNGNQPREGFFFAFDGLNWSISAARKAEIGLQGGMRQVDIGVEVGDRIVQTNSLHTGRLASQFTAGNRIELGRISDRRGWIFSTYRLNSQDDRFTATGVDIVFDDPNGVLTGIVGVIDDPSFIPDPDDPDEEIPQIGVVGDLPVTFDEVIVRNKVETWSIELMHMCRSRQQHRGGFFEWYCGVRYLEFDDAFSFEGRGKELLFEEEEEEEALQEALVTSSLANSTWATEVENRIFGPQIGLRWFRQWDRVMWSTEGRFLAGYNQQNFLQVGTLASEKRLGSNKLFDPIGMANSPVNETLYAHEFTPLLELRAEFRYQLTRAVTFQVGWTGIWMDGIARASTSVLYQLPGMGIDFSSNRHEVFMHGLTIGVNVNR